MRAMHASDEFSFLVYTRRLLDYYWGIPLGALCVIGTVQALASGSKKMLVVFLPVLAVICFKSLHKYVEAKYILCAFPLLAVCGAHLFTECFTRIPRRYFTLVVILMLLHPAYLIVSWDYDRAQKSVYLEAREWIEKNIPINTKILLDNVGNKGPKLENAPANIKRQYQRALNNRLMKADYLKLKMGVLPKIYYDIVYVNEPGGFRADDYKRYCLWQDLED
ncbi:unnamed protein product, partial [marine sediment metagenome]